MIQTYETNRTSLDVAKDKLDKLKAPRPYALGLTHKHLPEMMAISGLKNAPHFYPIVGDMAQGMFVTVHLWADQLNIKLNKIGKKVEPKAVQEVLAEHYKGEKSHFVRVLDATNADTDVANSGFVDSTATNGTNFLDIMVFGHEDQILIGARLDNLGKGASGAAVQCMNIACGLDERTGL